MLLRMIPTGLGMTARTSFESDRDDPSHTNKMRYFPGVTGDDYGSPPSIHFDVSVPASDYSLLVNNIRGGVNAFVGHSGVAP